MVSQGAPQLALGEPDVQAAVLQLAGRRSASCGSISLPAALLRSRHTVRTSFPRRGDVVGARIARRRQQGADDVADVDVVACRLAVAVELGGSAREEMIGEMATTPASP